MRKSLSAFLLVFIATSLSAQINFTVIGKIIGDTTTEVSIIYGGQRSDVPVLNNGEFSFSGEVKSPCNATLIFGKGDGEQLWLDTGKIEIIVERLIENKTNSSLLKITSVKGIETSENYFTISNEREHLYAKFQNLDQLKKSDSIQKYLFPMLDLFITKYPKSKLSILFIATSGFNYSGKQILFNKLDRSHNKEEIESLSKRIEREKKLSPGNGIDNFSMINYNGDVFQLNKLKSKYVLLEFWASWCVPCRTMRPELKKLYKKYHSKGLEIVGVSLDESKANWLKAIERDNVPWIEVSDLKGFNNSVAVKYNIDAIPFWVLIDNDLKIIETGFWTVPESTLKKLML